jgi:hypothetical protein
MGLSNFHFPTNLVFLKISIRNNNSILGKEEVAPLKVPFLVICAFLMALGRLKVYMVP